MDDPGRFLDADVADHEHRHVARRDFAAVKFDQHVAIHLGDQLRSPYRPHRAVAPVNGPFEQASRGARWRLLERREPGGNLLLEFHQLVVRVRGIAQHLGRQLHRLFEFAVQDAIAEGTLLGARLQLPAHRDRVLCRGEFVDVVLLRALVHQRHREARKPGRLWRAGRAPRTDANRYIHDRQGVARCDHDAHAIVERRRLDTRERDVRVRRHLGNLRAVDHGFRRPVLGERQHGQLVVAASQPAIRSVPEFGLRGRVQPLQFLVDVQRIIRIQVAFRQHAADRRTALERADHVHVYTELGVLHDLLVGA